MKKNLSCWFLLHWSLKWRRAVIDSSLTFRNLRYYRQECSGLCCTCQTEYLAQHLKSQWSIVIKGLMFEKCVHCQSMSSNLQVNGRNLLSVDYDRTLRTEKIYDDHRKFLLNIMYNTQGHPALWDPSSKLLPVNLTYSRWDPLNSFTHKKV